MRRGLCLLIASALSAGAGCALRDPHPEMALLYNESASHYGPDRNPIVVIPGILGSRLRDRATGSVVWGAFEPPFADPQTETGARQIALPIADIPLDELRDDVEPIGVLERVRIRLLGLPIDVPAYAGILSTLGAGGYRDEALGLAGEVDYGDDHFTCFQFGYDWRRDNVENARRLHAFLVEKREYVRARYRRRFGVDVPDIRFDIVAHSMGGLLTRYLLMYGDADLPTDGSLPPVTWDGAKLVERVVLVGTPSGGSVRAFLQLVEGQQLAPLLPFYPPAILGTFASVYQLLPRVRHRAVRWAGGGEDAIDLFDPAVWEAMGWGLASPTEEPMLATLMPEVPDAAERSQVARALQARLLRRAEQFQRALDRPVSTPAGLDLFLVAGDAIDTAAVVAVDRADGGLRVVAQAPGDGTVLRSSALLDERVGGAWSPQLRTPMEFRSALLLPAGHLQLTTMDVFRDNVLFWLLDMPRGQRPPHSAATVGSP